MKVLLDHVSNTRMVNIPVGEVTPSSDAPACRPDRFQFGAVQCSYVFNVARDQIRRSLHREGRGE